MLWALTKQKDNGLFNDNCLSDRDRPLTHTIGYALRGVIEAYNFSGDRDLCSTARKTADGLLQVIGPEGNLPGVLDADWTPATDWTCPTGSVRIAHRSCYCTSLPVMRDTVTLDTHSIRLFIGRFLCLAWMKRGRRKRFVSRGRRVRNT